MAYRYADPSGNAVQLTDDGRLFVTDNNFGQLVVGLTSEAVSGIRAALDDIFGRAEDSADLSGTDPADSSSGIAAPVA